MTVKVELGFTADGQGAPFFRLDDPVLGRLDDPNVFLGGGEVFVDVTEFFEAYSITRGKSRELDRYQAGQASVQFENTLRTFDPTFEASPYFGQIVPKRKIRITNDDIVQFEGSIEDWNIEYAPGGKSIAIAQAFDAFAFLSGLNFSGTFTEEKTDDRVNAVLDQIGWSATRRQIENTGADLAAQTVEDFAALEYLQTAARSEPGDFFAAKNNDLKLVGRNTPFTSDGVIFSADRQERSVINSTALAFKNGDLTSTNWKSLNREWITIDETKMNNMVKLLNDHINRCFNAENSVISDIDQLSTTDEIDQINLEKLFHTHYNQGN